MRVNGLSRPPNQATHELVSSGFGTDAVIWNKMGGIKQFKPGEARLSMPSFFYRSDCLVSKHIVPL
jgi:hypothetical protein